MRALFSDIPRLLRTAQWLSAVAALAIATYIVLDDRHHRALASAQLREQSRLKLRAAKNCIENYLDQIQVTLQFIHRDNAVMKMSADSRGYIHAIYEESYARHRMAEIYVLDRGFDGTHRPFMSFEKGDVEHAAHELHTPEREEEEYAVQIEQIRRFRDDPALESLISREIPLCVGKSGVVVSVPIRDGEKFVGIVAGMVPSESISTALEAGSMGNMFLLASEQGTTFGWGRMPRELRPWLREQFANQGVRRFFENREGIFHLGTYTAMWTPVEIAGPQQWYLAHLFDQSALVASDTSHGLAGWGTAGIVLLFGAAVAFLCRLTPALMSARAQADRRAEELAESEARTRTIVETAAEGIITIDHEGVIESFNAAAERVFGYAREEVIGRNIALLIPSPHVEKEGGFVAVYLRSRGTEGAGVGRELMGRRKDGTMIPTELGISEIRLPGRRLFTVILRDVSERKRAEGALRESREFLQTVIDTLPDPLLVIERNYRVVLANRAAQELSEWQGQNSGCLMCYQLAHTREEPCRGKEFPCPLGDVFATKKQVTVTQTYVDADGKDVISEVNAAPVLGASGEVVQIIHQSRDITSRVRSEEQARQRQAELARVARLGTMGEMATGLAHEINQPLAAIVNYLQACQERLRRGVVDPEGLMRDLAGAAAQATRAGEIVEHIRYFVRKREPRWTAADVNVLVREAAVLVGPELRANGIEAHLELGKSLPQVKAEAIQIEQVLVNLMRNGVEAMSENGGDRRALTIRTSRNGARIVEVAVEDSGPGLPPEVAEHVFDPFFTTKSGGMGMGLSISRSIIEAHGGRLWAASGPDGGTTFRFTLPVEGGGCQNES